MLFTANFEEGFWVKKGIPSLCVCWIYFLLFDLSLWLAGSILRIDEVLEMNNTAVQIIHQLNLASNSLIGMLFIIFLVSGFLIFPLFHYIRYILDILKNGSAMKLIKNVLTVVFISWFLALLYYPVKYLSEFIFVVVVLLLFPIYLIIDKILKS